VRRLHCVHRSDRGLLQVGGSESGDFLQGLVTNDMTHLREGAHSMYAMVLNSQGRVLHDVIIYNNRESASGQESVENYLVEVDLKSLEQLERHLKMYRLRKKIDINVIENKKCWVLFEPSLDVASIKREDLECLYLNPKVDSRHALKLETDASDSIVVRDPRMPYLGHKLILPVNCSPHDLVKDLTDSDIGTFTDHRYKLGVGEGPSELPPGDVMPLEANVDYLHGVSFHKGCYIGQELTARVFHTGVVRKRYMPVVFSSEASSSVPPETSVVNNKGKSVGRMRAQRGKHGVALLRVSECLSNEVKLSVCGMDVSTFKPAWWPIEAPK
ncbi:YgfZ/GcvT conserved site, partial [Trinorchestia longiramus]